MGASGLGALLVKEGFLTEQDRVTITKTCGQGSWAFAKCILSTGLLDEDELSAFFAERTKYVVAPKNLLDRLDPGIIEQIDRRMVSRLEVLPLEVDHHRITVAVADPLDKSTIKQLEFFTGLEVVPVIAPLSQIYEGLSRLNPEFRPRPTALSNFLRNHAGAAWIKQKIVDEGDVDVPQEKVRARAVVEDYDEDQVEDVSLDDEIDALEESSDSLNDIDAGGLDEGIGNSDFDDIELEDAGGDLDLAPGDDPDEGGSGGGEPIDDAGLDLDDPFDNFDDAPKANKAVASPSDDDLEGLESGGGTSDDLWPDADDAPAAKPAPAAKAAAAKKAKDVDFGLDDEPAAGKKEDFAADDLLGGMDDALSGLDDDEAPKARAKAAATDDLLDDAGDDLLGGMDDEPKKAAKKKAADDDLMAGLDDSDDLLGGSDDSADSADDLLAMDDEPKKPAPAAKKKAADDDLMAGLDDSDDLLGGSDDSADAADDLLAMDDEPKKPAPAAKKKAADDDLMAGLDDSDDLLAMDDEPKKPAPPTKQKAADDDLMVGLDDSDDLLGGSDDSADAADDLLAMDDEPKKAAAKPAPAAKKKAADDDLMAGLDESDDLLGGLDDSADAADDLLAMDDEPKKAAPAAKKKAADDDLMAGLDDSDDLLGGLDDSANATDDLLAMDDEPKKPAPAAKKKSADDDELGDLTVGLDDDMLANASDDLDSLTTDLEDDTPKAKAKAESTADDDLDGLTADLDDSPDDRLAIEDTPKKAAKKTAAASDTLDDDVLNFDEPNPAFLTTKPKADADALDDDVLNFDEPNPAFLSTKEKVDTDTLDDDTDDVLNFDKPNPGFLGTPESTRMAVRPAPVPTELAHDDDHESVEFADDDETSVSLRKAVHEDGVLPEFNDPSADGIEEETRIDLHAAPDSDPDAREFGESEDTEIKLTMAEESAEPQLEDLAMGFDESIDEPSVAAAKPPVRALDNEPGIDDFGSSDLDDIPIDEPAPKVSRIGGQSAPLANGSVASLTATAKANEALLRMSLCFDRDTALDIAREYLPQISGTGCLIESGKTAEPLATWRPGAQSLPKAKGNRTIQSMAKAAKPGQWSQVPVSGNDEVFGAVKSISIYAIKKRDGSTLILAGDYPIEDETLREALTSFAEQLGAK